MDKRFYNFCKPTRIPLTSKSKSSGKLRYDFPNDLQPGSGQNTQRDGNEDIFHELAGDPEGYSLSDVLNVRHTQS